MPDLKIAVTNTGPVPDNQCALKDAILVATASGISDASQIVEMARAFHTFLMSPVEPVTQPTPQQVAAGAPAPDAAPQPQPTAPQQ